MTEKTYITCTSCHSWNQEIRSKRVCQLCNNTQLMEDPTTVLCNSCGNCMYFSVNARSGTWQLEPGYGLLNIKVSGGFNSYYLIDMTNYTFNLCEKCIRNLFMNFKIKPRVNDLGYEDSNDVELSETDGSWEKDQEYYENRIWQDSDEFLTKYKNKICNVTKDCQNKAAYSVFHDNINPTFDAVCEEHTSDIWGNLKAFVPNNVRVFL